MPLLSRRSYSSGNFIFTLDDEPADGGYLKSVEGGTVKGAIIEEMVGPELVHFKHLSTIEIEPIGLELGMAVSGPMMNWIQKSWKRNFERKSGSIIFTDFDYRAKLEMAFTDALIVETTFPALDGSDKSPAYMKVKLHPEGVTLKDGDEHIVQPTMGGKQKLWSPSNFRMKIDGLDCSYVNKIDSISVKQKVKQFHFGRERHPQIEPTGLEYSNITLTMAVEHASDFIDWHQSYVVKGGKDTAHEKQGAIEFMAPNGGEPLLTLTLKNVGLFSLTIEKAEANAEDVKRCKVELYCEAMELDQGWGLE